MSTFLPSPEIAGSLPGPAPGPLNREIAPPIELGLPYWFHLFFPERALTTDLKILAAGGGDLSLRLARANPRARIFAVEERLDAAGNLARQKHERGLGNLELLAALPEPDPQDAFDLIYEDARDWHGASPQALLGRSAGLLRPGGALHLSVRAKHAWAGVRTVCELLRRLGIEPDTAGYPQAREVITALGAEHPWNLLGPLSRTHPDELLAEWLGPGEPSFSVRELDGLLHGAGLRLQRFTYHAYYLPQCSPLARSELIETVRRLPRIDQQSLMECYWPSVREHLLIACRADQNGFDREVSFDGVEWLRYAPLLPAHLPFEPEPSATGGKARLSWRAADMPAVGAGLGGFQFKLLQALDRAEELGDVVALAGLSGDPELRDQWARDFFRMMWDYDFLHFRTGAAALHPEHTEAKLSAETAAGEIEAMDGELSALAIAIDEDPLMITQDAFLREAAELEALEPLPDPSLPEDEATPGSDPEAVARENPETAVDIGATRPSPAAGDGALVSAHIEAAADPRFASGERIPYEACPVCGEAGYESYRETESEDSPLENPGSTISWMRCFHCAHVFTAGYFRRRGLVAHSRRIDGGARNLATSRGDASAGGARGGHDYGAARARLRFVARYWLQPLRLGRRRRRIRLRE